MLKFLLTRNADRNAPGMKKEHLKTPDSRPCVPFAVKCHFVSDFYG